MKNELNTIQVQVIKDALTARRADLRKQLVTAGVQETEAINSETSTIRQTQLDLASTSGEMERLRAEMRAENEAGKAIQDAKVKSAEDRLAHGNGHEFRIGDILHTSWGYSMTLNSFYQVVGVTAKSVKVVQLESEDVESDGFVGLEQPKFKDVNERGRGLRHLNGRARNIPEGVVAMWCLHPNSVNKPVTRRVKINWRGEGSVDVDSSRHGATLWDGKPKGFNKLD
jgi:hypothetical protein